MLNRITITAAALSSAAQMLADHSEESPDTAIMIDVERLSDLLQKHATEAGGSVPTEFVLTIEREAPPEPEDAGIENARGWLDSIREMVAAVAKAEEEGDDDARDEARQAIEESPLSVRVRDDWRSPGQQHDAVAAEYEILLSTGGPALRIIGELDADQPDEQPRLQWQNWFKPWTDLPLETADREALSAFVGQFYFGEG